jgi:hypothetical protein
MEVLMISEQGKKLTSFHLDTDFCNPYYKDQTVHIQVKNHDHERWGEEAVDREYKVIDVSSKHMSVYGTLKLQKHTHSLIVKVRPIPIIQD